jgi:hypothetical protein
MLEKLEIKLECQSLAKIADLSTGPSFAFFDVAREIDTEVGRRHKLRLRGCDSPSD